MLRRQRMQRAVEPFVATIARRFAFNFWHFWQLGISSKLPIAFTCARSHVAIAICRHLACQPNRSGGLIT